MSFFKIVTSVALAEIGLIHTLEVCQDKDKVEPVKTEENVIIECSTEQEKYRSRFE